MRKCYMNMLKHLLEWVLKGFVTQILLHKLKLGLLTRSKMFENQRNYSNLTTFVFNF